MVIQLTGLPKEGFLNINCFFTYCLIYHENIHSNMNVKKFLLLTLLFFLMVGTVSASDNVTGDDLGCVEQDINVTFDEQMWEGNLTDIGVELPENASGDFCVKIDDEIIYNRTITEKSFKVSINLPQRNPEFVINIWPPMDYRQYKISAFYNGIDLNITTPLKVMKYPPDYNIVGFPEEILQHGSNYGMMIFPRSANGTVEFYIDDRLFNTTTASPIIYWKDKPFSDLSLGNHTLGVRYLGDNYYRPFNRTLNFTVVNVIIDIPNPVNISHDDCIAVRTLPNVAGIVNVYIGGRLIWTSKTENGDFIMSLEKYLKYTDNEISVVYTGPDFSRTKTQKVSMTYDFDVWLQHFTYGEKNVVEIILPDTMNRNLVTVTIDGVNYRFTQPEYLANNVAAVDVSKLGAGNHSMVVSFKGDSKFYPLTRQYNLTVGYNFDVPFDIEYRDSSKAYLRLPANANGNLEVYVDGKLFKSSKMGRGYAEVKIDTLTPGRHDMLLRYTGTDYAVEDLKTSVYVAPKISLTYRFRQGEDKCVQVEVPKSCSGYVIFEIDGKSHKVNLVNGMAKYSLKSLKVGEHDIYISYYGSDGVKDLGNWRVVTVYNQLVKMTLQKVKIRKSAKKLTIKATLKINGKAVKGKYLKFKFNKKTYKVKTNKRGIAKLLIKKNVLKKLKVGKIRYQVSYGKKTLKRTVKVRR